MTRLTMVLCIALVCNLFVVKVSFASEAAIVKLEIASTESIVAGEPLFFFSLIVGSRSI